VVDRIRDEFNIQVTLVGSLPKEKDDRRIRQFINERNLELLVDVRANMSYEKLQHLYFEHDLFVLPSHGEPAAVSPLEAMANGLPVISSDDNGTRWYIEEGANGYVFKTGNIDDLEQKIRWIINDREELVRMGQKSYELANQNHHPDVYRERFIELVNAIF
jgi:glycosyltransferase involved in cell wall biosynthesis